MNIERINTYASSHTIIGWLAGLVYFNWFSSSAAGVPVWELGLLIIVGMFAASIIIGGGIAFIAAGMTKLITGRTDGSPHAYSWGAFVSPVVAFFAAKYGLMLFSV